MKLTVALFAVAPPYTTPGKDRAFLVLYSVTVREPDIEALPIRTREKVLEVNFTTGFVLVWPLTLVMYTVLANFYWYSN